MKSLIPLLLSLAPDAFAREITFPPIAGVQHPMSAFSTDEESPSLDISAMLSGITTYANLPYVHCLAGEGEEVEKYDIAVLGAPFDTVGFDSFRRRLDYGSIDLGFVDENDVNRSSRVSRPDLGRGLVRMGFGRARGGLGRRFRGMLRQVRSDV